MALPLRDILSPQFMVLCHSRAQLKIPKLPLGADHLSQRLTINAQLPGASSLRAVLLGEFPRKETCIYGPLCVALESFMNRFCVACSCTESCLSTRAKLVNSLLRRVVEFFSKLAHFLSQTNFCESSLLVFFTSAPIYMVHFDQKNHLVPQIPTNSSTQA